MGGKALLIIVTGFSLIYLVMGQNFGGITSRAVINSVDYHNETLAHNIAVSGAKMAASEIFFTPTWDAGFNNVAFQNGTINVTVTTEGNKKIITSIGNYNSITDTVEVILRPSNFAKFAYYSEDEESIWWATGDTVWGPFHTQDYLRIYGSPVFIGKVTTKKKITYHSGYNNPKFIGSFEAGVDLPLPNNSVSLLEDIAAANGKRFTNHDTVYITFDYDSVKYKYSYNGPTTVAAASELAPNGVICVSQGTVRLKGTVSGKYTIVASEYEGGWYTKGGHVFLDDNIVYEHDPRNEASSDMLGIVAENKVIVAKNSQNNSSIDIHAAIFCLENGFEAEDYSTRGISGNINLLGGITQDTRGPVGTIGYGGTISSGFNKRYIYDQRFMSESPPSYPNTNSFEIVSWLE